MCGDMIRLNTRSAVFSGCPIMDSVADGSGGRSERGNACCCRTGVSIPCLPATKGGREYSRERREDRQHSPQSPAGRDTHEGMVVEVVPLVPDSVIERISEERPAPIIPAPIRSILFRHHKDSIARLTADAIFLSHFVTSIAPDYRLEMVIAVPPGLIEGLFEDDQLGMHGWSSEEYLVLLGRLRAAVGCTSPACRVGLNELTVEWWPQERGCYSIASSK